MAIGKGRGQVLYDRSAKADEVQVAQQKRRSLRNARNADYNISTDFNAFLFQQRISREIGYSLSLVVSARNRGLWLL